jgi:hypothetical protein
MRQIQAIILLSSAMVARADFQGSTHMVPFDEEGIAYQNQAASGPIAQLQKRMASGESILSFDNDKGYLPSLLQQLKISDHSQMLVFSKTSFQRDRISPQTPRALFYSDDIYIGFIPNAPLLEISTVDPKIGAVFYTLEQKKNGKPQFTRVDQCLECHASSKTMGVPGHLVRSFMTDENGVVDLNSGVSQVNHRTPIEERWGGYYVTGLHGEQTHHGNLIGKEAFERSSLHPNLMGNLTNLSSLVDLASYPRQQSDIVALMVLEHQTHMQNFLTRLNFEASIHLKQFGHVKYLKSQTDAFLKYLLFVEEAPIHAAIRGDPEFQESFIARGPTDRQGRSLRQFDLQNRLFKYPCSYLIYSEAFEALPEALKTIIYQHLWDILTEKDRDPIYSSIKSETKRAILEILGTTKANLPDFWDMKVLQARSFQQ